MPGEAERRDVPHPCPICRRPADDRLRPFCSQRCADVDLGRWLTGAYAIPVEDGGEDEGDERPPVAGQAFEG